MGLLPDTQNCGLRMRREYRERFPRHRGLATHVPWCMPGSLTSSFLWSQWRGKRSQRSHTCAIRNITYLVRGPCPSVRTARLYYRTSCLTCSIRRLPFNPKAILNRLDFELPFPIDAILNLHNQRNWYNNLLPLNFEIVSKLSYRKTFFPTILRKMKSMVLWFNLI